MDFLHFADIFPWVKMFPTSGIPHSCKGIPHGIVEEAACKCIEMHACKYSYFKRVLGTVANSTDSGGGKSLPSHENIREKDLYKSDKTSLFFCH